VPEGPPPEITLRGPQTVSVLAGQLSAYTLCTKGAPENLMCDPGVASATDQTDGDLLAAGMVTACSQTSFLRAVGLAACAHIRLDVPGNYRIDFGATNSKVLPTAC
jgi:hypothetical protein